jgi:Ca-activated chloride channel family protein
MIPAPAISTPEIPGNGARLVSTDGRALPLRGASLGVDASGGVARVVLEQRFENPHAEPLAVTYSLPLPADAAVSGFAFRVGGRRVVGEIDRRRKARERYEEALSQGRSAALLEQDRSSLFTQEIGNVPPGEALVVEVTLDQRLRWLDEGAWEWRFPTAVAPRYLGEAGRVADASRVAQDVADRALPARLTLGCMIRDALPEKRRPESPSHAIDVARADRGLRVTLRDEGGVRLDRDVVVRWAAAAPKVGLALDTGRPRADRPHAGAAYGLLTLVPPAVGSTFQPVARDLIVLLDTSGSMAGAPLDQARRVTAALIGTLGERDQIELIEFSSSAHRWNPGPVAATTLARARALAWLGGLSASGGTEMRSGILEALRALRPGSQRQIILITDGQIGFEAEVVEAICARLPASARLHTVGVGSAVNRSLTGPAARAGRGVEVVIGLGEDPERAAARLVARTSAPLLVELELSGSALVAHAPARLPDLFAGAPALIGVSLRPEGGELRVRGRTAGGTWEKRLTVAPTPAGSGNPAAVTLFGRESVEDHEMHLAARGDAREIDAAVEKLGVDFQIATRLTSWIAVSEDETVDPGDALRHERMPHEIPHGMSLQGLGLRPAQAASLTRTGSVLFSLTGLDDELRADAPAGLRPGIPLPPFASPEKAARERIDLKTRLGKTTQIGARPAEPMPPAKSEPESARFAASRLAPEQPKADHPAAPMARSQSSLSRPSPSLQTIKVEEVEMVPRVGLIRRFFRAIWALFALLFGAIRRLFGGRK